MYKMWPKSRQICTTEINQLKKYIKYIEAGKSIGKCSHIDLYEAQQNLYELQNYKTNRYGE